MFLITLVYVNVLDRAEVGSLTEVGYEFQVQILRIRSTRGACLEYASQGIDIFHIYCRLWYRGH